MNVLKNIAQHIFSALRSNSYLIFLLLILGLLFYRNYTPGTWLTGWDNLHPEFNFKLNFMRAFHSVWQEYQGLGLLAGMAHAADLIRVIFLWLVSFIIPDSFNRYFFHFLMIGAGGIGTYFFLKHIVFSNKNGALTQIPSFLGALFYVFNLGSIQYMFVPFEPYSTFWGMFPWLLYTLFAYLKNSTKRNLILFALVNILALSQAYVQTIFLVYIIVVSLILAINLLTHRNKESVMATLFVVFTIGVINAFWILPQIYFVSQDIAVTQNAMQNQMATEKFYQMNKGRGTITDFMVLKEFYYDFLDSENGQTVYMMHVWRDYFERPYVLAIGYFFFALSVLGLVQKHPLRKYFISMFLFSAFLFLSNTPVIEQLNNALRNVPLANQIFRNPFTKTIVPTSFIFAVGFSLGIAYILTLVRRIKFSSSLIMMTFLILLGIYAYPAYRGEYISPRMRVAIPQTYFELFEYLEEQDKTKRIMNLPQGSYWGWYEYSWGLRGSGFIWYGIEQPIMDRAFDVWSDELEGYYWELSNALRKDDKEEFNRILEKYDVSYVLYDESLIHSDPFNPSKLAYKQQDFFDQNDNVSLIKKFGPVSLYETTFSHKSKQNISIANNIPNVLHPEKYSTSDVAYEAHGLYKTNTDATYDALYPFGSLSTNRFSEDSPFVIEETPTSYKVTAPLQPGKYYLQSPSFSSTDQLLPVKIYTQSQDGVTSIIVETDMPTIWLETEKIDSIVFKQLYEFPTEIGKKYIISINDNQTLEINGNETTQTFIGSALLHVSDLENSMNVYSVNDSTTIPLSVDRFADPHICGPVRGDLVNKATKFGNSLALEAQNTSICQVYNQSLKYDQNALLNISFDYKSNFDEFPSFCFYSQNNNRCLNHKDRKIFGFSNTSFASYSDSFEFYSNNPDTIYPQLVLEALSDEDVDKIKKITYKNVRITSYPLIEEFDLDFSQAIRDSARKAEIEVNSPIRITVEFSKNRDSYAYPDILKKNLYKRSAFNFDTFLDGNFELEEKIIDSEPYINLNSSRASSYLLLQAPELPLKYGYILSLTNENTKGLPLNLNIFSNKGSRNYTYTNYSDSPLENRGYYILPPAYEFDSGISMLMGTTSYTDDASENIISNVDIYHIPYNFLTNIYLEGISTENKTMNMVAPKTVVKENYYKYSTIVPSNSQNILLFQAFHSGWKAYETCNTNAFTCQIQNSFPQLFGKELVQVKINNWANGWELSPDTGSEKRINIIFWPQYLQYLGFGVFVVTLVGYGFYWRRYRK